ncbi:MAG: SPOR domain-containing protein [Candidatus Poseidoniaceae archaeon]
MQLSEDGNYMWNGTEWVPVEEQALAPAEEAETAPPTPEIPTPAVMPQETAVQPVNTAPAMIAPVIIKPGASPKPAINMAAAFSVFKYGIIALAGWFVSMILLSIVWYMAFDMAISSDSATTGMIILVIATLVTIIAYGQMIIYPVGKALKDGRSDDVSFSYVDSWKTSIAGFVESIVVTAVLALMIGIGIGYELNALWILGAIGYFFFIMGYVPYMVRKAAEIMR